MPRPHWTESSNPDRVAANVGARIAIWIVVAVVVLGSVGAGIWAFKVATSDVKGAGDQTRATNDGQNRINAQEWFHGQYGQILAADRNLDDAAKNLAASTSEKDREFWRTNYTGLKNRCNEMVAVYNAETQKVTRGKWLDPALPYQIDASDPRTDCREAAPATPAPAAS